MHYNNIGLTGLLEQPRKSYEYIVLVNGQEMWAGQELPDAYPDIHRRHPQADERGRSVYRVNT